jgi:DNA-binding transcriptional regulator/RsmH inhibitor MraZ
MGVGKRFEIWEPEAAARRRALARERTANARLTLRMTEP